MTYVGCTRNDIMIVLRLRSCWPGVCFSAHRMLDRAGRVRWRVERLPRELFVMTPHWFGGVRLVKPRRSA